MKAMILAAGLGTRLRPITATKPKALVEIDGVPLIEIVLKRLIAAGVTEVIINLYHFPEQIKDFLIAKNNFGIHIQYSLEETLLNTGGGLKNASYFFDDDQPFIVHNVDVLSDLDLNRMMQTHVAGNNLATLAVNQRRTKRYFIFDEDSLLCGWKSLIEDKQIVTRSPKGKTIDLAFGGIHILSPRIFRKMTEEGAFSIIDSYLRLTGAGERIRAFRIDDCSWQDVGKMEHIRAFND